MSQYDHQRAWVIKGGTYEERDVESGDEGNNIQRETKITADDTELRLEWQLIQSMSLHKPAPAETDVRKADTPPDEKVRKTGER